MKDKQTINRAEVSAAIMALNQALRLQIKTVVVCTDNRYINGITKWMKTWKCTNWKSQFMRCFNSGLWLTLDRLFTQIEVEWMWIDGHQDEINLKVDSLAKKGIVSECTYL